MPETLELNQAQQLADHYFHKADVMLTIASRRVANEDTEDTRAFAKRQRTKAAMLRARAKFLLA